jgi:hypothetical protein
LNEACETYGGGESLIYLFKNGSEFYHMRDSQIVTSKPSQLKTINRTLQVQNKTQADREWDAVSKSIKGTEGILLGRDLGTSLFKLVRNQFPPSVPPFNFMKFEFEFNNSLRFKRIDESYLQNWTSAAGVNVLLVSRKRSQPRLTLNSKNDIFTYVPMEFSSCIGASATHIVAQETPSTDTGGHTFYLLHSTWHTTNSDTLSKWHLMDCTNLCTGNWFSNCQVFTGCFTGC